jgi:geranylgeranyl reductase family protein
MRRCDVLIVGGGPAGSTCAWRLRQAGCDVVVWDRKAFPRDKICAGWITPQVVAALDFDPRDYAAAGHVFQPVTGFRVSRLGDREAYVRYDRPVSFAIRRCEFDTYLLRRSGAELYLGRPVDHLERTGGEWTLNGVVRAPILVGAGGHFCPVAQRLGARLGHGEPIVAAQEVEFAMTAAQAESCPVEAAVPELFFTRDLQGYGWIVRKGDYLNVGLGRLGSVGIGEHAGDFVRQLQEWGRIPAALPAKLRGHPYLLYDQAPRPLAGDGALLIGDAAGLAYPRSGEGIRPAVESGLLAADTILDARGHYGVDQVHAYERRLVSRFGPRRRTRGITDLLPESIAGPLAGRLLGTPWFARRVVLDRWFFHLDQPALKGGLHELQSRSEAAA